jgi:hypothetical protein
MKWESRTWVSGTIYLLLHVDVLLLADIVENLRATCHQYYKLDPACYLTAPSLAWDAMLKMTGVVLDNFVDYDMYLLIENNIRGGMCSVGAARNMEANIKYLSDNIHQFPHHICFI